MYKDLLKTLTASELKTFSILLREFSETPRPTLSKLKGDLSEAIMNKLETSIQFENEKSINS